LLEEAATDVLWHPVDNSYYMNTCAYVKEAWRDRLSEVTHVDGTTRPQIVTEQTNPFIYNTIKALEKLNGIPSLLNTSFNRREPLVETPLDALRTFQKMPINYLVLNNKLVAKVEEPAPKRQLQH